MAKKQKNTPFWKKIRVKYKLFILNENTLEDVFTWRVSRLHAIFIIGLFSFLLITLTSIIIVNTPIRNYLPGYMHTEVRKEILDNTLRADSLEMALQKQSIYLANLTAILKGDIEVDPANVADTLQKITEFDFEKSEASEQFVNRYEEEEKYNLTSISTTDVPSNIIFFRPVRGMISSRFDLREKHYGTDIAAPLNESVLSVLNGTVIYTGFDANGGNVIHIQHKNGLMSIYKHNATILKNVGDEVESGEAIALVGNTGKLSTGSHLHFEIWYNGIPLDPESLIVF